MPELNFKHCQFDKAIILTSIRWYVAYKLSYRNIEELMAERGIDVDHSTLNRWVIRYTPQLDTKMRSKTKSVAGDLSPIKRTMTSMKFPVNLFTRRSNRYEETLLRRTNYQSHKAA